MLTALRLAIVSEMMQVHLKGQRDLTNQLWALMVLEVWRSMYEETATKEAPITALNEL